MGNGEWAMANWELGIGAFFLLALSFELLPITRDQLPIFLLREGKSSQLPIIHYPLPIF